MDARSLGHHVCDRLSAYLNPESRRQKPRERRRAPEIGSPNSVKSWQWLWQKQNLHVRPATATAADERAPRKAGRPADRRRPKKGPRWTPEALDTLFVIASAPRSRESPPEASERRRTPRSRAQTSAKFRPGVWPICLSAFVRRPPPPTSERRGVPRRTPASRPTDGARNGGQVGLQKLSTPFS